MGEQLRQLTIVKDPKKRRWEWVETIGPDLRQRAVTAEPDNVLEAVRDFMDRP